MVDAYFSATYSDARGKFLAGCLAAGARVTSYAHPLKGPQGEALFADVARLGPERAERVLVVESGTHGVEGFCGSGVQVGLLTDPAAPRRPENVALVLVHAINPYGFAWVRRVNEDNVDVNRNFLDHESGAYPESSGYAELAEALVPPSWDEETIARSEAAFADFARRRGEQALTKAMRSGQYTHPDGVFFGGRAPSWSARLVAQICREQIGAARHASLIDIHSGRGPYGYGEPLTSLALGTPEERRARAWFGDDLVTTLAPETGYSGSGASIIVGYMQGAPGASWTPIGLEYGTRPPEVVRLAVRADAWLHRYGVLDSAKGREIKRALRDAFYPDDPAWRRQVWERGADMVARGLAGLAAA